jgi:ribonuclease-3
LCNVTTERSRKDYWRIHQFQNGNFETLEEKVENGRRLFTVGAVVDGEVIAEGKAFNKKDAGQIAAQHAVEKLNLT